MVLVLRQNGMVVMGWLASKNMSLFCFVLNCIFAFSAFVAGDLLWFMISVGFAALCFYNYNNATE